MHLTQSRIRNTSRLLKDIEDNKMFYLGIKISDNISKIIQDKLNASNIDEGQIIFPNPFNGIMSKRNAVGEFIPQKDKPKEKAYRSQSWEITDWGGYSHSGTSYVPYKRYPRLFVKPKEFKFIVKNDKNSNKFFILSNPFTKSIKYIEDILFGANLILEIFNEIDTFIVDSTDDIIDASNFETVNWEILPKGEKIWESYHSKTTEKLSDSEQILIKERFDYINEFKPDKVHQGIGGYTGYLVFEFTDLNLFIFDSILYGEAMYVFKDDWKHISSLTKKEIIKDGLAEERIVHNERWKVKLKKYFK